MAGGAELRAGVGTVGDVLAALVAGAVRDDTEDDPGERERDDDAEWDEAVGPAGGAVRSGGWS